MIRFVEKMLAPDISASREADARFFRVLGDPTRLAIVRYLMEEPHTVGDLVAKLGTSQSRVSNHLACLRWCRLVTTERRGRQVIYSIGNPRLAELLAIAADLVDENREHLISCRRIGPNWV